MWAFYVEAALEALVSATDGEDRALAFAALTHVVVLGSGRAVSNRAAAEQRLKAMMRDLERVDAIHAEARRGLNGHGHKN